MITTRILLSLTLACLTFQQTHTVERFNAIKSAGMGSAFGIILPTALGIGSHFLEKHLGIEHRGSWREDEYLKIEANKLLQTSALTIITALTWTVLKGFCANDARMSFVMASIYCYGQGRSFFMNRQSKLQKSSSYMLPGSLILMAYTRIPDVAPSIELAGKSLLVFGLAHTCRT